MSHTSFLAAIRQLFDVFSAAETWEPNYVLELEERCQKTGSFFLN